MGRVAYFYDIAGFSDPRIIEAGLHRTKKKRAAVGYGLSRPIGRWEEFDR
jgi:hypothetical protein